MFAGGFVSGAVVCPSPFVCPAIWGWKLSIPFAFPPEIVLESILLRTNQLQQDNLLVPDGLLLKKTLAFGDEGRLRANYYQAGVNALVCRPL